MYNLSRITQPPYVLGIWTSERNAFQSKRRESDVSKCYAFHEDAAIFFVKDKNPYSQEKPLTGSEAIRLAASRYLGETKRNVGLTLISKGR